MKQDKFVRVRSRQYLVEEIQPSQHDTLVRLACLEDDALGDALEVFWEREIDAKTLGVNSWETIAQRGFDNPRLFSAYLHTLRWHCVTSTDPKLFQVPYRARAFSLTKISSLTRRKKCFFLILILPFSLEQAL